MSYHIVRTPLGTYSHIVTSEKHEIIHIEIS